MNHEGKKVVFVFGSNLSGIHGAGAAKYALQHCGAVWGRGVGMQGQSCAIPTKGPRWVDEALPTLPLATVAEYAAGFCRLAASKPDVVFQLTAIGCGLAGFKHQQIYPLFAKAPANVLLPPEWLPLSSLPSTGHWNYTQFRWEAA